MSSPWTEGSRISGKALAVIGAGAVTLVGLNLLTAPGDLVGLGPSAMPGWDLDGYGRETGQFDGLRFDFVAAEPDVARLDDFDALVACQALVDLPAEAGGMPWLASDGSPVAIVASVVRGLAAVRATQSETRIFTIIDGVCVSRAGAIGA